MLEKYQKVIDLALKEFIAENSLNNSFKSIEYILRLEGKRIRPSLLLMSADLFGGDFSKYIETKHSLNAKQIAKTYGFKYQNKKTAFGVKFALKTFFKKSNRPKILEVTTPSHLSSSTLKNYFKFLANS